MRARPARQLWQEAPGRTREGPGWRDGEQTLQGVEQEVPAPAGSGRWGRVPCRSHHRGNEAQGGACPQSAWPNPAVLRMWEPRAGVTARDSNRGKLLIAQDTATCSCQLKLFPKDVFHSLRGRSLSSLSKSTTGERPGRVGRWGARRRVPEKTTAITGGRKRGAVQPGRKGVWGRTNTGVCVTGLLCVHLRLSQHC